MTEEWRDAFVRRFYVYNLEKDTPAGAEKEAIDFIEHTRKDAYEEGADAMRAAAIALTERIEASNSHTELNEWRAFKQVRNMLRGLSLPEDSL